MIETYLNYVEDVLDKKIITGRPIYLACQRFARDFNRADLEFKADKVTKALKFISTLKHFTGRHCGKRFILEPWQQFVIASVVGFYWKISGKRKYTSSYIQIARKNGKSALASALSLYFLLADGEQGAECIVAANSKEQAKISFDMGVNFATTLDPAGKYIQSYRGEIRYTRAKSKLRVIASDDSTLDGFNASFALLDEVHAAKNTRLRDVIRSSMGMRENPHLCYITTAGFDTSSFCYDLRSTCIEVLEGLKEDESIFIAIWEMDPEDDWREQINWIKSNPNLEVTVQLDFLSQAVASARNSSNEEIGVRVKNLNQWVNSTDAWIPDKYIFEAMDSWGIADFEEAPAWIGVDLASVSDLTAISWMVKRDDTYYFDCRYYLPESCLQEGPNKEKYQVWKNEGYLTVTEGNVTDYSHITTDLMKLSEKVTIQSIAYDRYNSTQWAIDCTNYGLPLIEYSQSLGNFNIPTKEFERLILSGKIKIQPNPITKWCLQNVTLKSDWNGNVKPQKSLDRTKKIDGVIAMVQALGIYLESPLSDYSIC